MFLYQCGLFVFEIIKLNHILEMQPTQLEWAWLGLPLEFLQGNWNFSNCLGLGLKSGETYVQSRVLSDLMETAAGPWHTRPSLPFLVPGSPQAWVIWRSGHHQIPLTSKDISGAHSINELHKWLAWGHSESYIVRSRRQHVSLCCRFSILMEMHDSTYIVIEQIEP